MKTKILTALVLLLLFAPASALISSISVNLTGFGIYSFIADTNYLVFSNFTGNDDNGWSGTNWSATSNRFQHATTNTDGAEKSFPSGSDINFAFYAKAFGAETTSEITLKLCSASCAASNEDGNGYQVKLNTFGASGSVALRRLTLGVATTLILESGTFNNAVDHNVSLVRDELGNMTLKIDNVQYGSTISESVHTTFGVAAVRANRVGDYIDDVILTMPVDANQFYVNELDYNISYNCTGDANARIAVDDVNITTSVLNCNTSNNTLLGSYTDPVQGPFNIKFYAIDANGTQNKFKDQNFISDLNAPGIDLNIVGGSSGFSSSISDVNVLLQCIDTISPELTYDVNNVTTASIILHSVDDANLTKTILGSVVSGENELIGSCTDLAGNQSLDFNTANVFNVCFNLVNEDTGADWTGTDINNNFSALRAVSYDTGASYNFKTNLDNDICFTSTQDDTIRFDINYSNGLIIYREVNLTLANDLNLGAQELDVCLATPQDFFEQLFTSAQQTPIFVQHILSECYNSIDYTKYTFEDSLSSRAFTISAPYSLTTYIDGNAENLLSLSIVNGAVESETQLDVLIFKSQPTNVELQPDEITISPYYTSIGQTDTNVIQVVYQNISEDNISVTLTIYDDTNIVIAQTITNTPNLFTTYFDFTGYSINSDVLKIVVNQTKINGSVESLTRYFTLDGVVTLAAPVAALLGFIFFIFVFTVVGWKASLGIFGFMTTIIALGILTMAPAASWIIVLQAFFLSGALYIGLIYNNTSQVGY